MYKKKQREHIRKVILESLKNGASIVAACRAGGVDWHTFDRWRKRSKRFNQQVIDILNSRTQVVEDALFKAAVDGNVTAQIFWLKNRAAERWRDVAHQSISGGMKIEFEVVDADKEAQKDSGDERKT